MPPKSGVNALGPMSSAFAITPHDSNALALPTRGIAFATAGALKILDGNGNAVTIPSGVLQAGVIHPIRATQVFSTGTTALNIWGFS